MSASIPQAVQTWLNELRTQASEATSTFSADESKVTKHRNGRVTVTLFFIADENQSGIVTPGAAQQSESDAVDAAEQLRGYGAETQLHSEGAVARVIGVFDAPSN
jgi:hypothetical protein